MTYLAALLYMLMHIARFALGQRVSSDVLERLQTRQRGNASLKHITLSLVILILLFLQYYILTGVFPFAVVVFLVILEIGRYFILLIARAVLGLDTLERSSKAAALQYLWGVVTGRSARLLMFVILIGALLLPVVVLVVYFSVADTNQPEKAILLSLAHFCLPAVAAMAIASASVWRSLASHFADDETRNYGFLSVVEAVLSSLVFVFYPAYLVTSAGSSLPYSDYVWILLAVPAVILLIGGVLPAVIGSFRYKVERSDQLDWLKRWLPEAIEATREQPATPQSRAVWHNLEKHIDHKFAESGLLRVLLAGMGEAPPPEGIEPVRWQIQRWRAAIESAPRYMRELPMHFRMMPAGDAPKGDELEKDSLLRWDFTSAYVWRLFDLREAELDLSTAKLEARLLEEEKDVAAAMASAMSSDRRNALTGLILTAIGGGLSVLASLLYKAFEADITRFIRSLPPP